MNILLIYPKSPETFWSFKHALSFIDKRAAFTPQAVTLDIQGYHYRKICELYIL